VRELGPTAGLLALLGYTEVGTENGWHLFALPGGGSGRTLEVAENPGAPRGMWGTGGIHHLAFRVADDAHEEAVSAAVAAAGRHPTPVIDRFWFRSVYFKEPGGVLFELATDGPGFAVDEDPAHLGERLVLPPWLEPDRAAIEAALPFLALP
jgi:glyoxalase family protein